jgi:hypothetical protein
LELDKFRGGQIWSRKKLVGFVENHPEKFGGIFPEKNKPMKNIRREAPKILEKCP